MLLVFACSKVNQLKQPTSLCFEVTLSEANALEKRIQYDNASIPLQQIILDGNRTEGSNIYFTVDYESVENIPVGQGVAEALNFDIPKGLYTELELKWEPPHGSIFQVEGTFLNDDGKTYPMRIELVLYAPFSIFYEGSGADFQVDKTEGNIVLEIGRWFSSAQLPLLNNAELVDENGQSILLINSEHNFKLYQHISMAFAKTPKHIWRINR